MTFKAAAMMTAGATLVGGIVYWWLKKPKAIEKPAPVKKLFPDEILPEQMEKDMEELKNSLDHIHKLEFVELCDKIVEDIKIETIPWFKATEFKWELYNRRVEFMMMGLGFVANTINRIKKGEYDKEFDHCIRESFAIAVDSASGIGQAHSALECRNVQFTVRRLLNLMTDAHYRIDGLPKEYVCEKRVG